MLRKHFALFVFIISNAMFVFVFNIRRVFEFLFCLVIDNFLLGGMGGWEGICLGFFSL